MCLLVIDQIKSRLIDCSTLSLEENMCNQRILKENDSSRWPNVNSFIKNYIHHNRGIIKTRGVIKAEYIMRLIDDLIHSRMYAW